ncbi:MAG: MarR family transcriptional regulator [Eggerthellales bacterium]|nr:MarR family transcriptional regulator [Eggerthellales bacterium]
MTDKYDVLKLENQLCFPLYACAREVVKRYRPFLDEIDLTYTQYVTMMVMWEHRSINSKEMGELLHLDSGTLTPVLKALEKKGLVTRARGLDRRNLDVTLTEAGEALKERAVEVPAKVGGCLEIDMEDAVVLSGILNKMLKTF